jgi:hypothetical protein
MTETNRETTPGATGGLPGDHAAPQNSELSDDERDETVSTAGVAPPTHDDDR